MFFPLTLHLHTVTRKNTLSVESPATRGSKHTYREKEKVIRYKMRLLEERQKRSDVFKGYSGQNEADFFTFRPTASVYHSNTLQTPTSLEFCWFQIIIHTPYGCVEQRDEN